MSNGYRISTLATALCLTFIFGCAEPPEQNRTPQSAPETDEGADKEVAPPAKRLIEAKVFVYTGGITFLALLDQKEVDAYVEVLVKDDENLHNAISLLHFHNPQDATLLKEWVKSNVNVRSAGEGSVAIGIHAEAQTEAQVIAIVNAICQSVIDREPQRLANEAQKLRTILQAAHEKDPTEKSALILQTVDRMVASERFKELPRVVEEARVVDQ